MAKFKIGDRVKWKIAPKVVGEIKEIFEEEVVKKLQDKEVKRHATKLNPAYLIETVRKQHALHLESELQLLK